MKFIYTVQWIDINKNTMPYVKLSDPNHALYVAKKRISEGMTGVAIFISSTNNPDIPEDESWPAIDNGDVV